LLFVPPFGIYISDFASRIGYFAFDLFFEFENMSCVGCDPDRKRLFPAVHRFILTSEDSLVNDSAASVFESVGRKDLAPFAGDRYSDTVFGEINGAEIDDRKQSSLSVLSAKNYDILICIIGIDPLKAVPAEITLPKLG